MEQGGTDVKQRWYNGGTEGGTGGVQSDPELAQEWYRGGTGD